VDAKYIPLLLGGVIPALLYGTAGILQKMSAQEGGTATMYLTCFGVATALTGFVLHFVLNEGVGTRRSIVWAIVAGVAFALGAVLISFVLIRYQTPVSQLSPLYNTNVLITVSLGLWLFAEYQDVNMWRLLTGAVLVVAGAILVSGA